MPDDYIIYELEGINGMEYIVNRNAIFEGIFPTEKDAAQFIAEDGIRRDKEFDK